jgi:glycosyltransferase involved in cell wall biosynthesis
VEISVVISTYNNCPVLRRTLETLLVQDFPRGDYEVIVADDGSTDGTAEMLETVRGPVAIRHVPQANRGLAAARNLGARAAGGRIVLFLDSDLWAAPGLLRAHHRHYPPGSSRVAVQGRSVTHPDARRSLFMQVREMSPDFTPRRRERLSPLHVVGRNFSLLRADLEAAGGFDEGFPGYGWEDVELAMRLCARGVVIAYEPEALGHHYHAETLESMERKWKENGGSAVYLWRKHGRPPSLGFFLEIAPALLPLKWLVYRTPLFTPLVRRTLPVAEARRWRLVLSECYNHLLWKAYCDGVFETLRAPRRAADAGGGPLGTCPGNRPT